MRDGGTIIWESARRGFLSLVGDTFRLSPSATDTSEGYDVTLHTLFSLLVDTALPFKSWVERATVVISTNRHRDGPFRWCGRRRDEKRGRGRNFAGAKRGR